MSRLMRLDLIFQAKFVICNLIQSSSFFAIRLSSSFINATLAFFYRTMVLLQRMHLFLVQNMMIIIAFSEHDTAQYTAYVSFQCIQCPK